MAHQLLLTNISKREQRSGLPRCEACEYARRACRRTRSAAHLKVLKALLLKRAKCLCPHQSF